MNEELSEAVRVYLGFGTASWPQADTNSLTRRFGNRADQLHEQIGAILNEAEQFSPDWSKSNLAQATRRADAHMRKVCPELTDEAIRAIVWAWSYWNK